MLQARLIAARRLLLLGRLDKAQVTLARLDTHGLPPLLAAVAELAVAELALRSLRIDSARTALDGAHEAAVRADVPALSAKAWPDDVDRDALIACAFRTHHPNESHRARLRVEISRLRALVTALAHIEATARGFVLKPLDGRAAVVLTYPIDGDRASLVALLSDGAAWSTSALALGASQRTVQRALFELEAAGQCAPSGERGHDAGCSLP